MRHEHFDGFRSITLTPVRFSYFEEDDFRDCFWWGEMLVVVIEVAFFEPYADDFGVIFPEGPVIILLLVRYGFSDVYAVPPFLCETVGVELVRGFPILCWMETKHFKAHVFYDNTSSNMCSNVVFLAVGFGLHALLIAIFDETTHENGWNARRVAGIRGTL